MKKYFYLAFLITSIAISQENEKYDYFININTTQLSQKMDLESFFEHEIFESKVKNDEKVKWKEFIAFVNKSKPLTIHGNNSDSIQYFQITLPIVDATKFERFIQDKIDQENEGDSIVNEIKKYNKYNIYNPKNDSFTVAWNEKNVVFYQVLDFGRNSISTDYYQSYDENGEYENSIEEAFPPADAPQIQESVIEAPDEIEVVEELYEMSKEERQQQMIEDAVIQALLNNYYENYDYEEDLDFKNIITKQREQKQQFQEEQIASMFENGLKVPSFDKINAKADISAWLNYEATLENVGSIYRAFSNIKRFETQKNGALVKGMNFDFFFENDQAKLEQTVEYSSELGEIIQKIVSRKPNKKIFNFFPKQEPIGYLSYHFNSEELLKNYPKIIDQMLSGLQIKSDENDLIMEVISTMLDEKATATLFDGDFSMFLHGVEPYEYTFVAEEYDEDFELVEVEKTITKTKPIFTIMMTSTHPTMSQKLLELAAKKNVVVYENGNYSLKDNNTFGKFMILREGDVLVFTNGLKYLNNNGKSNFSKAMQKQLENHYFYSNFDIQKFLNTLEVNQDLMNESVKLLEFKNQFSHFSMKSPKKITQNKMYFEMELKSNFSDKNIILQLLDRLNF